MRTLILRVKSEFQSWGVESLPNKSQSTTKTCNIPTKSGVVGLIGNSLGLKHATDWQALNIISEMTMCVAVVRPGSVYIDFQTVSGTESRKFDSKDYFLKTMGGSPKKLPIIYNKEYLCGSEFYVGISHENIGEWEKSLDCPSRSLYFGRKNCIPQWPISMGIYDGSSTYDALVKYLGHQNIHAADFYADENLGEEWSRYGIVRDDPVYDENFARPCFEKKRVIYHKANKFWVYTKNVKIPCSEDENNIHRTICDQWPHLHKKCLYYRSGGNVLVQTSIPTGGFEVREIDIEDGQILRFEIESCPRNSSNGVKRPIFDIDNKKSWLAEHFLGVIDLLEIYASPHRKIIIRKPGNRPFPIWKTNFSCKGVVTNVVEFLRLVESGVGPKPVYGCGMIRIKQ